jgi:hypothetical protein
MQGKLMLNSSLQRIWISNGQWRDAEGKVTWERHELPCLWACHPLNSEPLWILWSSVFIALPLRKGAGAVRLTTLIITLPKPHNNINFSVTYRDSWIMQPTPIIWEKSIRTSSSVLRLGKKPDNLLYHLYRTSFISFLYLCLSVLY